MAGPPSALTEEVCSVMLKACQECLDYQFRDVNLLKAALTHASGAEHRLASNERMEFLGDSILGFIVCKRLYHQFPEYLEGEMTRIKSIVVSREVCARVSRQMGLGQFLILGKGMITNPQVPLSVLAAVFESLIAAIYLDGGEAAVQAFIARHIWPEIDASVAGEVGGNYKSLLQQLAQREYNVTPSYYLLDEKGPDHSKCFKISARIGHMVFPPAWGRSKKESEQRAAHNALRQLRDEPILYTCE